MTIEINATRPNISGAGDSTSVAEQSKSQSSRSSSKILTGDSVKVSDGAMTDLEKLVAKLKNENEEMRKIVAQRKISILLTVLNTMNTAISDTQRNSLVKLEALNGELGEAERELESLKSDKSAAEGRSAALDAKIKALEEAIERAVDDGEAHRKQVAKLKEQKEHEDKKVRELEGTIASTKANIASINGRISECFSQIGETTLGEVAAAVRVAASEATQTEKAESPNDVEKKEKKLEAYDLANIIHDSLEKLDEDIEKTIEANQEIKV